MPDVVATGFLVLLIFFVNRIQSRTRRLEAIVRELAPAAPPEPEHTENEAKLLRFYLILVLVYFVGSAVIRIRLGLLELGF